MTEHDPIDDAFYGPSMAFWNRPGRSSLQVLNGEKPVDLPVQQITKIGLTINLKNRQGTRPHRPAHAARPR
jgi:hypothetical protein